MAANEIDPFANLESVTDTGEKKPCGCRESELAALGSEDMAIELDSALSALAADVDLDSSLTSLLSQEEELAFAGLEEAGQAELESILTLVEKYPGLKITFSF